MKTDKKTLRYLGQFSFLDKSKGYNIDVFKHKTENLFYAFNKEVLLVFKLELSTNRIFTGNLIRRKEIYYLDKKGTPENLKNAIGKLELRKSNLFNCF